MSAYFLYSKMKIFANFNFNQNIPADNRNEEIKNSRKLIKSGDCKQEILTNFLRSVNDQVTPLISFKTKIL